MPAYKLLALVIAVFIGGALLITLTYMVLLSYL